MVAAAASRKLTDFVLDEHGHCYAQSRRARPFLRQWLDAWLADDRCQDPGDNQVVLAQLLNDAEANGLTVGDYGYGRMTRHGYRVYVDAQIEGPFGVYRVASYA